MTATEVFGNDGQATVTAGGTTAPSAGTTETWNVGSITGMPTADPTATPPTVFHVVDSATGETTEKVLVTDSRTSAWAVTRGVDGSVPIAHQSGFLIRQVVTKGWFAGVPQTVNGHTGPVVTLAASDVSADAAGLSAAETTRATAAEALKLAIAQNLADLQSTATARTNLGLGSAATQASSAFDAAGAAAAAQAASVPKAGGTMTGWLAPAVVALTDGATISIDADDGNDFRVTIAGNRTMANPTNPADGQMIEFQITQDATGSRIITWSSAYDFGAAGAPTLTTTAAKTDLVGFKYNATAAKWFCTGSALGF
jgi:hypothetical protein